MMINSNVLRDAKTKLPSYINKNRPGLLIDERTGLKSKRLDRALDLISKDIQSIGTKAKNKMTGFPSLLVPTSLKGGLRYDPHFGTGPIMSTDLHPANIAQGYAKHSVYGGKHATAKTIGQGALQGFNKHMRWIIPSAMLGGRYLADKIPGILDDKVFNTITKYGPEAYLATALAANAMPAIAAKRALSFMPKGRINSQLMKQKLIANALKIGGSYGIMALGRKLLNKESSMADVINIAKGMKPRIMAAAKQTAPGFLAGGATALILAHLAKKMAEEEEVPRIAQTMNALPTVKEMLIHNAAYGDLKI